MIITKNVLIKTDMLSRFYYFFWPRDYRPHYAFFTLCADEWVFTRNVPPYLDGRQAFQCREKGFGFNKLKTLCHNPKIPDFVKPAWQNMSHKPINKLFCIKWHGFGQTTGPVILVPETNFAILISYEPAVGNGYPVGILTKVFDNMFGPCKRVFGINYPFIGIDKLFKLVKVMYIIWQFDQLFCHSLTGYGCIILKALMLTIETDTLSTMIRWWRKSLNCSLVIFSSGKSK